MPYDLFISYSSHDRAWARRLETDLRARGVNCFLDQLRLTKGDKWEPQLIANLLDSRHFLVLWSEKARASDWVSEELVRYKVSIDPKGDGQTRPGHLLYALNLEGQNATLSGYHGFLDADIQKAYQQYLALIQQSGAPPQNFDLTDAAAQQAWNTCVAEIAAAARSDHPAIQVPVAVLALTTEVMLASPPVLPEFDFIAETEMDVFLQRLGAGHMAQLGACYGTTPFDWHPMGGAETVRDVLNELISAPRTGINVKLAELNQPPIQWRYLDVVKPPVNLLIQAAQPLFSGPCLVIVDPVSLFSLRMWGRYVKLKQCFTNPQAAIAFLTPFGSDPPLVYLRQCLAEQGKPNLEWFHDPIPYDPAYANCGINIADKWDIRRLVLASLGRQPSSQKPSGGENIVN
jgi:hypothetical protein